MKSTDLLDNPIQPIQYKDQTCCFVALPLVGNQDMMCTQPALTAIARSRQLRLTAILAAVSAVPGCAGGPAARTVPVATSAETDRSDNAVEMQRFAAGPVVQQVSGVQQISGVSLPLALADRPQLSVASLIRQSGETTESEGSVGESVSEVLPIPPVWKLGDRALFQ